MLHSALLYIFTKPWLTTLPAFVGVIAVPVLEDLWIVTDSRPILVQQHLTLGGGRGETNSLSTCGHIIGNLLKLR